VIYPFTDKAQIDWDRLEEATKLAVRALNEVLMEGLTLHPLEEQQNSVSQWRQIGLGTLGLADCLIKLGIKYGSQESIEVIDKIYSSIAFDAIHESIDMAKELGCFPACDKNLIAESSFIKRFDLPMFLSSVLTEDIKQYGLYNSQLLTCAPTGSIGTMFGASTGVEPQFALSYTRKTQSLEGKDTFFKVNAKIVDDYIKATGNENLPDYFVTSADINPQERVRVQAALQQWIDASISSTVNLPKEATIEQVEDIYLGAWKNGLKGITVYRSGCKREGVLITETPKPEAIPMTSAPKRPKNLITDFHSVKVKGEQFIVLVGLLEGKPYEVFAFKPNMVFNVPQHEGIITKKSKMHYAFKSELVEIKELESVNDDMEERATTLYVSMLLRHGVAIKYIIKTAKKVNSNITSFSSAICRILSKYIPAEASGEKCPECGGNLINEGGCQHCESCGYSKCG
jgi:ribonucleoside-diphosphate reductase alpha chain